MLTEWMNKKMKKGRRRNKEIKRRQPITFLASFSSEFLQNSGLGSFETFFDGT
jgi:hypothetical protein